MIELDGTPNKSKLGANAILGVSLAVARAVAREQRAAISLFGWAGCHNAARTDVNILNGGVHANWQGADIQEFMIAPVGRAQLPRGVTLGQRDLSRPQIGAQGRRVCNRRRG